MKYIKLLFFSFILIPVITLADDTYEITVINKGDIVSGLPCLSTVTDYSGDTVFTKSNKILKYGDILNVKKEEIYRDSKKVIENGNCWIKYSDFIGGKIDPDTYKITKYNSPKSLVLLDNKVNLYGGNNKDYLDFSLSMDRKIIFEYLYSKDYKWFYVKFGNDKCNLKSCHSTTCFCEIKELAKYGWVNVDNKNFGIDKEEILYFPKSTNVYDKNGNVIGTIPSNTEITKYYYTYENNKKVIYVYYDNIEGFVYDLALFKGNTKITTKNSIKYKNSNSNIDFIDKNSELDINYFNFSYKDRGFIYFNNSIIEVDYNDITVLSSNIDIKNNGFIKEIFNEYEIMEAPFLNYELTDSNKEDKELMPENYIKSVENVDDYDKSLIDTKEENIQENTELKTDNLKSNRNFKIILCILAFIIFCTMIFVYYMNSKRK